MDKYSDKNLVIQGDNNAVINSLLEEGWRGKISFIYIDPPYFSNSEYGSYSDKWHGGMDQYIAELMGCIAPMKELLADDGVIAVHLDWHAVHYVKVEMDKLFGYRNFVNELIWSYKSGGASKRSFAKKHDNILVYSKTKDYYYNPRKEKSYNRGGKPYRFKGVEEFCDENGWYTMVNQKDVIHIDLVGRSSSERTGYPTQKPEKLLDVLIESFTEPGDLTADFFAGSGTLAASALKNGRRFIICDREPEAIEACEKRLPEGSFELRKI